MDELDGDEIRLRVCISMAAHPELAAALMALPGKMRGERLRTLATFGAKLMAWEGGAPPTLPAGIVSSSEKKIGKGPSQTTNQVDIEVSKSKAVLDRYGGGCKF